MAIIPILLNVNVNDYLTDYHRGMLTGAILLLLVIILIHKIDSRFHIFKRNGEVV